MGNDQVTAQVSPGENMATPSTWLLAVNDSSGVAEVGRDGEEDAPETTIADEVDSSKKGFAAYFFTKRFYIILVLGQVLALCITATNTFNSCLAEVDVLMPAFQTFFNYALLNIIYTGYTIYRYGIKGWFRLLWKDGWKFIILAFFDVEGNYFIVLAYDYTTILSAQLINFWAIVVVVILSFFLLRVRYHWAQILGILVCIGGMGVLLGSDHITGSSGGGRSEGDQIKGDLFALLGASFYGLANVTEEYLVSKRPLYEVVGLLAFFGTIINGTQAAIFDRDTIRDVHWTGEVGGYIAGYTLCLSLFYSLTPIMFRLSSAAFFNISLLTANFWGVIIGVEVFGLSIHWMYPIAFVLIIVGQFIYYIGRQTFGESRKPWLGRNQEDGISGLGTAKKKIDAVAQERRTSDGIAV